MSEPYFYKYLTIHRWKSRCIPSDIIKNFKKIQYKHKFSEFIYDNNDHLWFLNCNDELTRIHDIDETVNLEEIYYYGADYDKVLLLSNDGKISYIPINKIEAEAKLYEFYREWLYINKKDFIKGLEIEHCRKRTRSDSILNDLFKYIINSNEWISVIDMKNYIIGTPLNDILILRNKELGMYKADLDSIIVKRFEQNKKFQKNIMNEIRELILNLNMDIPDIKPICDPNSNDSYRFANFMRVLRNMELGTPIIYRPVLYNCVDKLYGIPDLLIKGKYINILLQTDIIEHQYENYYYAMGIKSSKLKTTKTTSDILRTNPLINYYKLEFYIYNQILGQIQGYEPNISFILNDEIDNIEQLTSLNQPSSWTPVLTNYKEKYFNAIEWVNYFRKEGLSVNLEKPTRFELIPNIKSPYDSHMMKKRKLEIIEMQEKFGIQNISSLWYCTECQQIQAWNNNLLNWKTDTRDIAHLLGFNQNSKQYELLSLIIKINQNNNIHFYIGKHIPNIFNEKKYIYVDLEYLPENNFIFMIGVGWYDNKYNHKTYIAKDLTKDSEVQILQDFYNDFIKDINPTLITWGHAEKTILSKRLPETHLVNPESYIDLCNIFKQIPIVIKGALNFSLKSIVKALYNNKLINTNWSPFTYKNLVNVEMSADILNYLAYEYYSTINHNKNALEPVIKYNMVDTKTLWEIHFWLKNNFRN
jgi:hypothetical protein